MNPSRHALLEAFPLIATSLAFSAIALLPTVLRHVRDGSFSRNGPDDAPASRRMHLIVIN